LPDFALAEGSRKILFCFNASLVNGLFFRVNSWVVNNRNVSAVSAARVFVSSLNTGFTGYLDTFFNTFCHHVIATGLVHAGNYDFVVFTLTHHVEITGLNRPDK
jgi:hypothetical protein